VCRSSCSSNNIICLFSSVVYPFARNNFIIYFSLFYFCWLVKYIMGLVDI
jgi:hypothetical protein